MVKIIRPFQINTTGNRTTEEVVTAGNYDWTNGMVNGKNFPMRPMPEGPREIVYLEFDHNPTPEEAFAEAERRGLERPRYEDALFFGEQHPEEQRNASIVFLHEPWRGPRARLRVLVLGCVGRDRHLVLFCFGGRWFQRPRFAFVCKS